MEQQTWTAVDEHLHRKLVGSDPVLDETLAANVEAKLLAFDVAPNQGKLLHLLVRMCRANRVLEIGTLGGLSTIWLVLLEAWPELLRVLWRERHPDAHEQRALVFAVLGPPAQQTKILEGVPGRAEHRPWYLGSCRNVDLKIIRYL